MSVASIKKLFKKLLRKGYRDAYCSEHVTTGLSFQVKALREQRGLSQKELATITGMKQATISRIENPDYGKLSLTTLIKLANAFDTGMLVKFVPFSEFIEDKFNLSTKALMVDSFKDEIENIRNLEPQASELEAVSNNNVVYLAGYQVSVVEVENLPSESILNDFRNENYFQYIQENV